MARTCSPLERATIAGDGVNHLLYLLVEDADGVMQDCTSLGTLELDLLDGASWGETLDTAVSTGSLTIRRDTTDDTASPTMGASSINRTALGAYAPFFEKGRAIELYTATVPQGGDPLLSDRKPMFFGRIDAVHWQDNPMTIDISDMGSWIADAQLLIAKAYASDSTVPGEGPKLGDVIQAMLTDAIPAGDPVVLYEPVSAPFQPYSKELQEPGSLLVASRRWAQEIGWDLRYRFDAADDYRLTLYEPARGKTAWDWSIGPAEYSKISNLTTNIADIRNQIVVQYKDVDNALQLVTAENPTSVAKYGGPNNIPRIWQFPSATIRTAEDAQRLADAVLSDLSEADADQEVTMPYFWPVQIGDLIQFPGNGDHYDSPQLLAVVSYTHTFANGEGITTLQTRGKVAGAYRAWVRWMNTSGGLSPDTRALALKNFHEIRRTPENITYGWNKTDSDVDEIWVWLKLSPQDIEPPLPPDDDEDRLWCNIEVDKPSIKLDRDTVTYDVKVPDFGFIQTAELQPVDKDLKTGYSQQVKVLAVPDIPRITSIETVEGATGLFTDITSLNVVDPQARGGTLRAWVNHDFIEDADPALAPDGTIHCDITPRAFTNVDAFTIVGGTSFLFDNIRIHAGAGKRVAFEFVNDKGTSSGVIGFVLLGHGGVITPDGELQDESIKRAEQIASNMTMPQVYDALPATGRDNELAVLRTSTPIPNKMYRWTGSAWEAVVAAPDLSGLLLGPQLASSIIDQTKMATNLSVPEIMGTLSAMPAPGKIALVDGVLYRSTATNSWTASVNSSDLNGTLSSIQIANGAITTLKIALGNITTSLIAGGAIDSSLLAAGAVTVTKISDGAIETPKLAVGAVTAVTIATNAITAVKIGAGEITATKLGAGAVTAVSIGAGEIIAGKLGVGAVIATNVAAAAIQAGNIDANAVTVGTIAAGAVNTTQLAADAIISSKILAGEIRSVHMRSNDISGDKILAGSLDAGKIVALTIQAGQIATDAIITSKIQAGAVKAAAIDAGAVLAVKLTTTLLTGVSSAGGGTMSNLGVILVGKLQSLDGLRYLELNGTGSTPFLQHPGLTLRNDGTATFSGALSAASGSFAGNLSGSSITGATGTFSGTVASTSFTGATITMTSLDPSNGTIVSLGSAGVTQGAQMKWDRAGTSTRLYSNGFSIAMESLVGAAIVTGTSCQLSASAGTLFLNGSTAVQIQNQVISFGAANSGGAGFRQVLVPN